MTTTADTYILPALSPHIRTLTTEQTHWLRRQYPSLPASVQPCLTCGGAGEFRWYLGVGSGAYGHPVTYRCPCGDQFMLHRRLLWGGVRQSYQRLGWADLYDWTGRQKVVEDALDYLANAGAYIRVGMGLMIYGTKGNGKTMVAMLLHKGLIDAGFDGYATTFEAMIQGYASGWDDPEARRFFDARVRNAGVLLIDDLGREHAKALGDHGRTLLEAVVRERVAQSMPTIITSNLTPTEIAGGYGGHVQSLLGEKYAEIEVQGADRRREVADRSRTEIREGLTRPVVIE